MKIENMEKAVNGDPAVQRINVTIDGAIAKGGEREERVARARAEYLALAKEGQVGVRPLKKSPRCTHRGLRRF